jgi:peptidoglycan/LPS O-acetylase OafA/YrhL
MQIVRDVASTVDSRLLLADNRPRGFDYLRLGLALGVVFWHSFWTLYLEVAQVTWFQPAIRAILPMFFALSGFLISSSLVRTKSIREFLTLRAIRILPALAIEITLSALVIGSLLTSVPIRSYFSDPVFARYFLNMVGYIHFNLPGVFADNPTPRVNQSLWTIPYELECYLAITLLWLVRAIRSPKALLLIVLVLQAAVPLRDFLRGAEANVERAMPGRVLVLAFLYGVLIYFYRKQIRVSWALAAAAAVIGLVLAKSPDTSYYAAAPLAYLTVVLGVSNPPRIPVLLDGDYSYGIYLYAMPFQQAVTALFPAHRVWWFNFIVAMIPTGLFAAFSWHLIEKPILTRRKIIVAFVDRLHEATFARIRPRKSASPA